MNNFISIAGIDYSITSPAIVTYSGDPNKFSYDLCKKYYFATESFLHKQDPNQKNMFGIEYPTVYFSDTDRFDQLARMTVGILLDDDIEQVYLEGYSMGSKGKVFNLAENMGILKLRMFEEKMHWEEIAPTAVKKSFYGKGNANKDSMYEAFVADTNLDLCSIMTPNRKGITSPISDIVDAYAICKHGLLTRLNGS